MLAVTYAADPSSDDLAPQFRDALRDARLLCGWVALEGGRRRPH